TPEKIGSIAGGGGEFLHIADDPREPLEHRGADERIGVVHALGMPKARIGQMLLTGEHRSKLWQGNRGHQIGRDSSMNDIDFRLRGKYANVAGPYLPPPLG